MVLLPQGAGLPSRPDAEKDRVLEGLAQSCKAQDKLDRAIEIYQRLAREYPKSHLSRQALYQIALIQKDRLFHFSEAEHTFRFIIDQWPNSPESIDSELQLGECLIADGKLEEAEPLFQKILEREEEKRSRLWVRALISLSEVFYFMGDVTRYFDLKQEAELEKLSHAEEIKTGLSHAGSLLEEETVGVLQQLKECLGSLGRITGYLPESAELRQRLESAYIDIKDRNRGRFCLCDTNKVSE